MAAFLVAASAASAQERTIEEVELPRGVADDVIAFFNAPATIRFQGRADVPAGRVIQGDVAVLGGPIQLSGEIQGDVVVVNGNLVVLPGGRVSGDVTIVGGEAVGEPDAVGGQLTIYGEALSYRRRGERISYNERPWAGWGDRQPEGSSYFSLRNEGNYNRVEGLPLMFGPVFRTQGDNAFRAEAMGVWKSESGIRLAPREWGYLARVEQHFGWGGHFSLGATAHSLVTAIEDSGFEDIEASLGTFLLHRDFRDYYEREGFSAFLRYDDNDAGVRFTAEYRDEDHAYLPYKNPWTIRDNNGPWRPQPLVGEGRLRAVTGSIRVDDRNDRDDPSDGWYLSASATKGLSGDLSVPELPTSSSFTSGQGRPIDTDFSAGSLDLRRYLRLGPSADFRVRGFLAGSIDGKSVPPQFQRALGGEGSLPGFPLMTVDCGARTVAYPISGRAGDDEGGVQPAYAGYGCDRVALFQAEYRGELTFNLDFGDDDWDEGWGWYPATSINPSWSVFFDAGRGWSLSDPGSAGYLGPDSETLMDLGIGLFLGDLGLYWAWPLNGEDRDVNFFIRIDHRF